MPSIYFHQKEARVKSSIKRHNIKLDKEWRSFFIALGIPFQMKGNYVVVKKLGRSIPIHLIILPPKLGLDTDHINGNPRDNRKSNLRYVTRSQNLQNRKKLKKTGVKGVHPYNSSGQYLSKITHNKVVYKKVFKSFTKAVQWRKKMEQHFFGEFNRK